MTTVDNKVLTIKSPAFENGDFIPSKYTCDGYNISPELIINNIPEDTKSLALILEDPDAPGGTYNHWLMWDIPVKKIIEENSTPGIQGKNEKNENKYTGPCPPSGVHHHYYFRIYALDTKLYLPAGADKNMLLHVMNEHVLASGELIGLYKRQDLF